jgi:SAM-dependent methyltransferase
MSILAKSEDAITWAGAIGRRAIGRSARCFSGYRRLFSERVGLEIGGPSPLFQRLGGFPVYQFVGRIDNCNFAPNTEWSAHVPGRTFIYDRRRAPGEQFLYEAHSLRDIPEESYDFVLSANALEHVANPVRALMEWIRVLKKGGPLLVAVPNKVLTFDHRRTVTTLAHLLEDYEQQIEEDDLTHLPEILALHDLRRDPPAGDFAAFKARSERNLENRCLHHHVFDIDVVDALLRHLGLRVLAVECVADYQIIAMAQKPGA